MANPGILGQVRGAQDDTLEARMGVTDRGDIQDRYPVLSLYLIGKYCSMPIPQVMNMMWLSIVTEQLEIKTLITLYRS